LLFKTLDSRLWRLSRILSSAVGAWWLPAANVFYPRPEGIPLGFPGFPRVCVVSKGGPAEAHTVPAHNVYQLQLQLQLQLHRVYSA
jgi:hypothetical protein